MKFSKLKQLIKFNRDAITKGWFYQYLKSGDVISAKDRNVLRAHVAGRSIAEMQEMLNEDD